MPKILVEPHRTLKRGKERWVIHVPKAVRHVYEGKRRRFFHTEKQALKFAADLNSIRGVWVGQFGNLEPGVKARLWACFERLDRDISHVEAAVAAYSAFRSITRKTLVEAANECFAEKQKARGLWSKYVSSFSGIVKSFIAGRENDPASEVTPDEISQHVFGQGWSPETIRGNLSRLRTFFSFCKKRGYCAQNPAEAVDKPGMVDKPPGILTVDECRMLLKTCLEADAELLPYFSIGLFAGVRPEEIVKLTWEDVRDGWIRIAGPKAKTRRRRLVEIVPPLGAWLELKGTLPKPVNFRKRWRNVRKESGVRWVQDCMRHSFCSYALPIHGATKTSLMAGHSEAILFQRYRELVPKAEAERFWKLTPEACAEPTKSPGGS